MVVALANIPPLRRGTPIGSSSRGDQVTMNEPFFRWLELATEVARGTASQTEIDALDARVGVTESQIVVLQGQVTVLQGVDVTLAAAILSNALNIAAAQSDITQLQTDVAELQSLAVSRAARISTVQTPTIARRP